MKKILFVVPSLTVGGMERMQVTLANALHSAGYDITIITLSPDHTLASELNEGIKLIYRPYREFPVRSRIKYIWTFYDDGVWETRSSPRKLHRYYIGKDHYDVEIAFFRGLPIKIISGGAGKKAQRFQQEIGVHRKNFTPISPKSLCTEKSNTKHIAWVHNDFRKAVGYKNNFKSLEDVHSAYAKFDKVICVSQEAQAGFREVIGDTNNLTTIYNLLPVEEIKQKAEQQPEVLVYRAKLHLVLVGRLLDSAKGQKRLIDVVAKLHEEGLDISLALVGGGSDEQMLQNEIADKNSSAYITMTGSQMNPYPYIKQADMLICASYFEGYNLTVAEALILETPVLSTNCTGPNEILDHGKYGMIVENSEEGLYKGIRTVAEHPQLLEELQEKAIARKDFFDEARILKEITDLFGGTSKK
jgi:glycosyltransferase involved in cell wall biosynthesis